MPSACFATSVGLHSRPVVQVHDGNLCERQRIRPFRRCTVRRALTGPVRSQAAALPAAAAVPGKAAAVLGSVASAAPVAASSSLLGTLSSIVGVLVLMGSLCYKVPQVVRLARRKSGEGLSVTMYILETIGTSFSALYFTRKAFAFSMYGELVFVVMQNVIILTQIVLFEKHNRFLACAMALVYAAVVAALLSPAAPLRVLMGLQIAAIPILNLARVPQILLNWRRKSTGELSPITLGLQVLGNVARIFTTLASVRDLLMLIGVLVSTAFNSTLVGQWLYYRRRTPQAEVRTT